MDREEECTCADGGPSAEERAMYRRMEALRMAVGVSSVNGTTTDELVATAKKFADFIESGAK